MNAVADTNVDTGHRVARTILWLIKRELWENRIRLLLAPTIAALILLISLCYGLIAHGEAGANILGPWIGNGTQPPGFSQGAFWVYLSKMGVLLVFVPIAFVASLATLYYATDALLTERRDRSVLFWKSLPFSDLETVASKFLVAAVAVPVFVFALGWLTHAIGLAMIGIAADAHGMTGMRLGAQYLPNVVLAAYSTLVLVVWYLPVMAWCFLASAWAQRSGIGWAVLPFAAAWFFERQLLNTRYVETLLAMRLTPKLPFSTAFGFGPDRTLTFEPGAYFASSELWLGLAFAAGAFALTVWLRRYREST